MSALGFTGYRRAGGAAYPLVLLALVMVMIGLVLAAEAHNLALRALPFPPEQ